MRFCYNFFIFFILYIYMSSVKTITLIINFNDSTKTYVITRTDLVNNTDSPYSIIIKENNQKKYDEESKSELATYQDLTKLFESWKEQDPQNVNVEAQNALNALNEVEMNKIVLSPLKSLGDTKPEIDISNTDTITITPPKPGLDIPLPLTTSGIVFVVTLIIELVLRLLVGKEKNLRTLMIPIVSTLLSLITCYTIDKGQDLGGFAAGLTVGSTVGLLASLITNIKYYLDKQ